MNAPDSWRPAPESPRLGDGEVHVWRVDVCSANAQASTLSPAERARADRFRSEADSARFVASHAALRDILARYLGVSAGRVEYVADANSKPHLAGAHAGSHIKFNLSHSGDIALVAVTRAGAVGVDVERVAPTPEYAHIAEQLFSPAECDALVRLPESDLLTGFFTCWTRKEACIKARGEGFLGDTRDFTVTLGPEAGVDISHLALMPIDPGKGYVGAVAVMGDCRRLACFTM